MSKERYAEHTVAWELPNRDSVTKGNYNLADIETKYLPIQTEVVSDSKDQTINKLQQRIAELEEQLKNSIRPRFKLYDTVYTINRDIDGVYNIESGKITQINFDCGNIIYQFTTNQTNYCHTYTYKDEENCFTSKEEAQAKLEELKGE